MRIEECILRHLVRDEAYLRKVVPFLKQEYFEDSAERTIFRAVAEFVVKYNAPPSIEALSVDLAAMRGLSEEEHKKSQAILKELQSQTEDTNPKWLLDETEKFCQDKAIYNAIMESITILDGKSKTLTKESLPELLKDALGVSFDTHIGHDFLEDATNRWDYYHKVEERLPFDLDYFNKITRGGTPKKSLNILLAGTGVGKTLAMCHMAAANMMLGKKVLYITMEMSEQRIAERIDANLMNVPLDELETLPKDAYEKKVERIRAKTTGKLIIKEYPTAAAHVGHFRHLINELNLKRDFVPDVIYVDYLNICCSARIKAGANVNSYTYVKSIAEELRGLAVEKNVPIFSATQTTRSGFANSDPGLEDTSESFGLPATADFMVALVATEELQELDQIMVKQLKNRYNSKKSAKRFVIGVDYTRMKLYDVEQDAQKDIMDGPVMDHTEYGERAKEEDQMQWVTKKAGRKDFGGLKVS